MRDMAIMGPIWVQCRFSRPYTKDLEQDAPPESICRGECQWWGWLAWALQWQILCWFFRTRPAACIRRPNKVISLFHLDWSACFFKLADHNDVASDVDQTDVSILKMGSDFFSIGGVRLVSISERLYRSPQPLLYTMNQMLLNWAFNLFLILRNNENYHHDH